MSKLGDINNAVLGVKLTKYGYERVSTIPQDLEVQLNRLKEGDTMVITNLDQFARSTVDAIQTVEHF